MRGPRLRRQLCALVAVLGLAALFVSPPILTAAQPVAPVPPPEGTPSLLAPAGVVDPDAGPGLDRAQPVEVREAVLPPGVAVTIDLDLLPGDAYTAVLQPEPSGVPGWSAWNGVLAGVAESDVSLVRRDDVVTGLVTSPEGAFHLRFDGDGHVVEEVVGPAEAIEDEVLTLPGTGPDPGLDGLEGGVADALPPATAADPAPIDVLVAYTPGAESAAGGASAIQSLIASAVSSANSSWVNSGIGVALRLVGTQRTIQEGAADEATLGRLRGTTDGSFDELHTRRNALGADLVALVVGGGQYCGIAYFPVSLTDPAASASSGFSVTASTCAVSNMSFAHELGHNLSAAHDRFVDSYNPFFPEGFAHVNTVARWRTVMAYNNQCSAAGFTCTRLARWSNPDQSYDGAALGAPGVADNQNAVNGAAPTIAAYRAPRQGTGSINGTVRTTGGSGMRGVRVRTTDGLSSAVTGADGRFTLPGLPFSGGGQSYTVAAGVCVGPAQSVVVNGAETLDFTATGLSGGGHRCTQDGRSEWVPGTTVLSALAGTDDASTPVTLPFPVEHMGRRYSRVHVSTNGHLSFAGPSAAARNQRVPDTDPPNAAVHAFWDDLELDGSSGVYRATAGSAPNRRVAIEWRNVVVAGNPSRRLDVEVLLYEDRRIRVEYRNVDPTSPAEQGAGVTVGIEDATGQAGLQASYDGAVLASGTALTFVPAPPPTSTK